MGATSFRTPGALPRWLKAHHAKGEETRRRRLETLVGHWANVERLPQVVSPSRRRVGSAS